MKKRTWLLVATLCCLFVALTCLVLHEEWGINGSGCAAIVSGSCAAVCFGFYCWLFKRGE